MSSPSPEQSDVKTGILAAVGAYTLWGMLPLFLIALRGVGADQVLMHRVMWSVPFGALIISARGQWPAVRAALASPQIMRALLASSAIIALNWLVYIGAVQSQHIFEASLGYYINPLIYVLVGVVALGERLTRLQILAVALAAIGVSILTVYGGKFPVIALTLGISFTAYGYIRKTTDVGAMPGLFIETLLLAPVGIAWMIFAVPEIDRAFGADIQTTLLLIAAGPVTVIPLLLFAIGARRLPLSMIGFLQFIGPTLQFIIGVMDGEPFTRAHQICFGFIWAAAAVFAVDAIRSSRRSRALKLAPVQAFEGGERRDA